MIKLYVLWIFNGYSATIPTDKITGLDWVKNLWFRMFCINIDAEMEGGWEK